MARHISSRSVPVSMAGNLDLPLALSILACRRGITVAALTRQAVDAAYAPELAEVAAQVSALSPADKQALRDAVLDCRRKEHP